MMGLWALLVGCGSASFALPDATTEVGSASRDLGGITVHAVRTGWVQVKEPHRELTGSESTILLRLVTSRRWAEWMPVISYIVEHPDGLIVVDTGPGSDLHSRFDDVDALNRSFYRRNLRFHVSDDDRLATRCAALGLDCASAQHLVITHFHADHIGEMAEVANATVWTGPGNWPSHVGATPTLVPDGMEPQTAEYIAADIPRFSTAHPLTPDGRVAIVPLPGHTPGHVGLWIRGAQETWVAVGDATFDQDQTDRLAVCGVSESPEQARESQALLQTLHADGVGILPSHDPTVFERLRSEVGPGEE